MRRWWVARVVAPLLHLANAHPPFADRERFYALKGRLLARYGAKTVEVWQQITQICYGCEGTGVAEGFSAEVEVPCQRCDSSGVWDRFWVRLEVWTLGRYTFHRPVERTWWPPAEPVTIHGRITHARDGHASGEACLWLALLYDRSLWWSLMTTQWPGRAPWPYLLSSLNQVTGPRATALRRCLRVNICWRCARRFRHWPWVAQSPYCRCCRQPEEDEVPF